MAGPVKGKRRHKRYRFNSAHTYKVRQEIGRYARAYRAHPATGFRVDVSAVRRAIEPAGSESGLAGKLSGGRYVRLSAEAAQRVADALINPDSSAAIRNVYKLTGQAGRRYRGNGVLVDACLLRYDTKMRKSVSTHVDGCPNPHYGGKVSAYTINVLIQLEGVGQTGLCLHLPDSKAHYDSTTKGYRYCAAEGRRECRPGTGLVILTSVAHTPLPQTGVKLVLTLFFPPPKCRPNLQVDVSAAWRDSEENGWQTDGHSSIAPYAIPWVVPTRPS